MSIGQRGKLALGAGVIALCHVVTVAPAQASPEGDLRDQARRSAQEMRAAGAPQNRCSISAWFANGYVVESQGALNPGDKLFYVNNQDVQHATDDEVVTILKGISPDTLIPVRVERRGEQLDLQVQCTNAADHQSIILTALDQAGRKKFEDCVTTLAPIAQSDVQAAAFRYQCAAVSDDSESYDLAGFANDVVGLSVAYAQYKPDMRQKVLQTLRANQAILQPAAYQALVQETKQWPGGETLFEDTQPDWNQYRATAEAALATTLFDPGSAQIEWPYGFLYGTWKPFLQSRIEGYWTCGRINAKNRMGGYVGTRYFVVVMGHNADVIYNEMGDGSNYDFLEAACANSVRMLPAGSSQFTSRPSAEPKGGRSVAEELAQLAQLKADGALTEEEYQAAKAKVLGTN